MLIMSSMAQNDHMEEKTIRHRRIIWVLFILYLVVLTYFLFFSESLGRAGSTQSGPAYNLELFKEIKRFYTYRELLGYRAVFLNLAGNVLAFIPFGFMLPVLVRRMRTCLRTTVVCFLFSLVIETAQLIFMVGSFDVDDLLLNTFGGILGYLIFKLVLMIQKRRNLRASRQKNG